MTGASVKVVEIAKTEIERIVSLSSRPPVNCDKEGRLYAPAAQALIEVETAKYAVSRPPLLDGRPSCACKALGYPRCIDTLNAMQAWTLRELAKYRGTIALAGTGSGKCVKGDTEFFDVSSGRRRLVTEVGDVKVLSFDGKNICVKNGSVFPSGYKQCRKVELADGSSIGLSLDHKVYTHRGWIEAGNLEIGDFVAVPTTIPEPVKTTEASDEEVILVAYLLADGGCNNLQIRFTNSDKVILDEFKRLSFVVCNGFSHCQSRSKAEELSLLGSFSGMCRGVEGSGFREKWGLYGLAKEKRLHPKLWGLPKRQVALFLNRFWACYGHISKRELEMTLAFEKMIDDIRFMLLRLGIRSRKKYKKAVCEGKIFDAWRISISGQDAVTFFNTVGNVLSKEVSSICLKYRLNRTKRNTNFDVVPISRREMYEICDELGFFKQLGGKVKKGESKRSSIRSYVIREFVKATDRQCISRFSFIKFCEKYGYTGKYSHLAVNDLGWERVVKISEDGEHPVYDLNVPETHNFVANNMLVHNTMLGFLSILTIPDRRVGVLFIKPDQRVHYRRMWLRAREHFRVPSLVFDDGTSPCVSPGAPVLHVVPYTRFSRPESAVLLEEIAPDFVAADEMHKLAGKSTTSMRWRRFMGDRPEGTVFCGWSGSGVNKSVRDVAHLLAFSLGKGSPYPVHVADWEAWSAVLDPSRNPDKTTSTARALYRTFGNVKDPGEDVFGTALGKVREGLKKRLIETPGVVTTKESPVLSTITFKEWKVPPIPDSVKEALAKARGFRRPDGDWLLDELAKAECVRQVGSGFYYKWAWPGGEPEDLIEEWFEARKVYFKEVRKKLEKGEAHLDSPKLLDNAAERAWRDPPYDGDLPTWYSEAWPRWNAVRNRVKHEQRAEWIDDFFAKTVAKWAKENKAIVWYLNVAFGERVASLAGLPLHGGGPDAEERIRVEKGDRAVIASIKAHGEGRDELQFKFSKQLVAELPSGGKVWQQLLGRLLREGQEADVIETFVPIHVPENQDALRHARDDAEFVQAMTPNAQTLLSADGLDELI